MSRYVKWKLGQGEAPTRESQQNDARSSFIGILNALPAEHFKDRLAPFQALRSLLLLYRDVQQKEFPPRMEEKAIWHEGKKIVSFGSISVLPKYSAVRQSALKSPLGAELTKWALKWNLYVKEADGRQIPPWVYDVGILILGVFDRGGEAPLVSLSPETGEGLELNPLELRSTDDWLLTREELALPEEIVDDVWAPSRETWEQFEAQFLNKLRYRYRDPIRKLLESRGGVEREELEPLKYEWLALFQCAEWPLESLVSHYGEKYLKSTISQGYKKAARQIGITLRSR